MEKLHTVFLLLLILLSNVIGTVEQNKEGAPSTDDLSKQKAANYSLDQTIQTVSSDRKKKIESGEENNGQDQNGDDNENRQGSEFDANDGHQSQEKSEEMASRDNYSNQKNRSSKEQSLNNVSQEYEPNGEKKNAKDEKNESQCIDQLVYCEAYKPFCTIPLYEDCMKFHCPKTCGACNSNEHQKISKQRQESWQFQNNSKRNAEKDNSRKPPENEENVLRQEQKNDEGDNDINENNEEEGGR